VFFPPESHELTISAHKLSGARVPQLSTENDNLKEGVTFKTQSQFFSM